MHFNNKLIILLFSVVFENALCKRRYYLNDMCLTASGINGICKLIDSCPSALQALKTQNIFPKNCGFAGNEPIVCCVNDSTVGAVAVEFSTRMYKPTTKRRPTIVSTSTERSIPQVGVRRQQNDKCSTTSGINGICKLIDSCPSALQALKTQNIFPKNCGFEGNKPIVCCVNDSIVGIVAADSRKKITKATTKRIETILSTSTQRAIPQVGKRSKLNDKCSTASGRNGICKQIHSCPSALQAIRTQNIFPKTCSFEDHQPIVCCVID